MPRAVPRTTEYGDGITAIDTDLLRPLFDASHLIVEGGRAAFVDTGVNSSVPLFLATLQQKTSTWPTLITCSSRMYTLITRAVQDC